MRSWMRVLTSRVAFAAGSSSRWTFASISTFPSSSRFRAFSAPRHEADAALALLEHRFDADIESVLAILGQRVDALPGLSV
jgi:hypothetical protein